MHPRKPRSQFRSSRVRRSCTLVRCRRAIETFAAAAPLPSNVLDQSDNDRDSSPPDTERRQLPLFARATKPCVADSAQLASAPIAIALSNLRARGSVAGRGESRRQAKLWCLRAVRANPREPLNSIELPPAVRPNLGPIRSARRNAREAPWPPALTKRTRGEI